MGLLLVKKQGIRRLLDGASISAKAVERLGGLTEEELKRLLTIAENVAQTHGRRRISPSDIDAAWSRLHKREEGYEV